jgi:hypothetical protein
MSFCFPSMLSNSCIVGSGGRVRLSRSVIVNAIKSGGTLCTSGIVLLVGDCRLNKDLHIVSL